MNKQLRNSFLLLLTAFIWGIAFVAQSVGMDHMGPFTFNGTRFLLGALSLVPVIAFLDSRNEVRKAMPKEERRACDMYTVKGGVLCGLALSVASVFQQFGILYTSVGKAGFLTALYIIIVPFLGLLLGKKITAKIWICGVLALAGLYLISVKEGFSIGLGDTLVICCAVCFAVQIMIVDSFVEKADGVKMSCIQFLVCGIICTAAAFIFETPRLSDILEAWIPICYAGFLSSGVAYTLQIVGQKGLDPSIASLIMSLESVFSALAGFVLLGQILSVRELAGCAVVFLANTLAQLPDRRQ